MLSQLVHYSAVYSIGSVRSEQSTIKYANQSPSAASELSIFNR